MKDTSHSISTQIENLLQEQKAFVFYTKPGEKHIRVIIQKNRKLYSDTSGTESGFIFAPFDPKKPNVFFPLNESVQSSIPKPRSTHENSYKASTAYSGKQKHIDLVTKTIRYIQTGTADKIVISKSFKIQTAKTPGKLFDALLQHYNDAFIYLWHHPEIGLWIGASPEKLLQIKDNKLHTMALAGTQTYGENLVWHKKEKDEQAWVTQYIESQLSPFVKEIKLSKTYTKKAGHLAHICCDIEATLKEPYYIYPLIKSLHPTPAVCGVPRKNAMEFILENEGYDRSFYTGYLGEIHLEKNTDLYVNLRCMQIEKEYANLYVGGGITHDSKALDEWNEIVNKTQVLGKLL